MKRAARQMLAEITISLLLSLDVILFVRAYNAHVAYKSRARQRAWRKFIAD